MDIEYYKKFEPIFGAWKIEKLLGEGSFGKVFEISKEEFGATYRSALKVITIPQSESDIKNAEADGMDAESIATYYRSFVEDFSRESSIMSKLKGHTNIVSFEDTQILEHKDSIGWDIFIRMELLTPLNDYLKAQGGRLPAETVLKLGTDLCKALEICEKNNIIHRDIKPENIFVSEMGDFKLGDFGISRIAEKTSGASTKVGTKDYMAPEVFRGEKYDRTVDTYSLSLVLYKLLNGNRLPFLPPAPQGITFTQRNEAMDKRMSGVPIPMIPGVDAALSQSIIKGCSFKPADRYSTAAEMLQALTGNAAPVSPMVSASTIGGSVSVPADDYDTKTEYAATEYAPTEFAATEVAKTEYVKLEEPQPAEPVVEPVKVEPTPVAPQPEPATPQPAPVVPQPAPAKTEPPKTEEKPKKKKKVPIPLIIGGAVLLIVIIIVAVILIRNLIADLTYSYPVSSNYSGFSYELHSDDEDTDDKYLSDSEEESEEDTEDDTEDGIILSDDELAEIFGDGESGDVLEDVSGSDAGSAKVGSVAPSKNCHLSYYNTVMNIVQSYTVNQNSDYASEPRVDLGDVFPDLYKDIDLDGDGLTDTITRVTNTADSKCEYIFAFGTGEEYESLTYSAFPGDGEAITYYDYNGDNIAEILITHYTLSTAGPIVTDGEILANEEGDWISYEIVDHNGDPVLDDVDVLLEGGDKKDYIVRDVEFCDDYIMYLIEYASDEGYFDTTDTEVILLKYDGDDFVFFARPKEEGWDDVSSWTWPCGIY